MEVIKIDILGVTYLLSKTKDVYLVQHHINVCRYSLSIGHSLGLEKNDLQMLVHASLTHDVGKIGIPDNILFKKGPLTEEEWYLIKWHPVTGAELLEGQENGILKSNSENIIKAVRQHHEKWDGNGYPDKLKGEDISLYARIIAVADAYDAMTTDRPYKKALSVLSATKELIKCQGSHFDPYIIKHIEDNSWISYFNQPTEKIYDMFNLEINSQSTQIVVSK